MAETVFDNINPVVIERIKNLRFLAKFRTSILKSSNSTLPKKEHMLEAKEVKFDD